MNLFFWYYAVFAYILIECKSHDEFNIDKYLTTIDDDLKEWTKSALNDNYNTKTNETKTNNNCLKNLNNCPPSKFSEINGRCNNVFNVNWGRRGASFSNWLHTNYINEINQPGVSKVVRILKENEISENKLLVTTLMVSWIDFVLEDIGQPVKVERGIENCCNHMYYQFRNECQPIIDDNHCLPYTRSLPSNLICNLSFRRRNQMNSVSGFLDASPLYGNNNHEMLKKRSFTSGLLNDLDINYCQSVKFLYGKCNPLMLIFLKEHNRIAKELLKVNDHWSDDEIFWEARRIVIAEIQHITYNEFLFNLLGELNIKSDDQLMVKNYGFYKKYSSAKKIEIFNEIVTGVLPALLSMYPTEKLKFEINEESYEKSVLTSFLQTLALMPNINFTGNFKTVMNYGGLNKEPEYVIHQSRDHGLSSYVSYANTCSKSYQETEVFKFQDLKRFGIPKDKINVLKSVYRNVNDIDLIIGGIFEEPLPGSIVGPTFACLLKKQFILLRQSDRFWYENDLPPSSFSLEQIQEIKKIRLSSILCVNFPHFESLPSNIFITEDDYLNSQLNCNYYQLPALNKWKEIDSKTEELTKDLVRDAIFKAENLMLNRHKMEYNAWKKREISKRNKFAKKPDSNFQFKKKGFGVDPKSPSGTAAAFSKANKYAVRLANISHLYEYASKELINSLEQRRRRRKREILDNFADSSRSFLNEDYVDSLQSIDMGSFLSDEILNQDSLDECNDVGPCDSTYEYRTYTGHCNNLKNPLWGKSLTPFTRLLEPRYDDFVSAPKTRSISHRKLPSPRQISMKCHADVSDISHRNTLMLMQFAQFLDHDLTMTPIHQGFHESVPDCRNCASARFVHPECNPIPIPDGDPFYPVNNQTTNEPMCLPFMRSLPGQNQLGYREQLNQNTAFLDGSQIYGENQCISHKLKGSDGKMNSTVHFSSGKELLPRTSEHPECRAGSGFCFLAGDGRASEQAGLTMIHTIFMREHNRILDELKQINPHWDGEKLFQVVRKIVIAELQHITYNEFLPRILGWETMNRYGLELQKEGYYKGYNDTCNPSVFNEFAAAAYRIGHSMLRPFIPRLNSSYDYVGYLLLRDTFFNPDIMMEREMVDEIARGMASTPMEKLDKFVTAEVTNHLFEDKKIPHSGVDLIALNIQRGRDHGLPGYTEYRQLCKLPNADNFAHLLNEIPIESVRDFKGIYESVHDIDLFPGGLSERPLKGGLAGPTFSCIMGLQFRELRRCDRFWYENDDPVVGFKANQLAEIRKVSLAKVICANFDRTSRMQRSAFDVPDNFLNPRLDCDNLPAMNMSVWKDYSNEGCFIGRQQIPVGHSAFPSPCTSCICTIAGAQCASLRVTNCDQLMKEWTIESILKDDICATQCAYHLARAQQKQRSPRIPSQFQTNFLRPPPPPPPKSSLTGPRSLRDPSQKRPAPHQWRPFGHSASLNANTNLNSNNAENLNPNRPFRDFSDFAPILNPIL